MWSFLRSVLIGVVTTFFVGTIFFLALAYSTHEGPIKSTEDLKNSTTSLFNSLNKLKSLNSRSEQVINDDVNLDEFVDKKDLAEQRSIKKSIDELRSNIEKAVNIELDNSAQNDEPKVQVNEQELTQLKKDVVRLQTQLDRIENNSRLMYLQIKLLEKQNATLKKSVTAFASGKKQNTEKK